MTPDRQPAKPTAKQRAEMQAYIDKKQPGLLDELGVPRNEARCVCGLRSDEHPPCRLGGEFVEDGSFHGF